MAGFREYTCSVNFISIWLIIIIGKSKSTERTRIGGKSWFVAGWGLFRIIVEKVNGGLRRSIWRGAEVSLAGFGLER